MITGLTILCVVLVVVCVYCGYLLYLLNETKKVTDKMRDLVDKYNDIKSKLSREKSIAFITVACSKLNPI